MLTNYHTHTCFCDGDNTPEELVLHAIDKGFKSLGFSGHGYTPYDLTYCMKDTDGYITQITKLKEKYKEKIQIYCGIEEDAFAPAERNRYDYILGSAHYLHKHGHYYAVDANPEAFAACMEVCDKDALLLAETYYGDFVDYIIRRKPDIVGHFDLITKFDEIGAPIFLGNPRYEKIAESAIEKAAGSGCLFEVNTGAISRGYRTSPYPAKSLLYVLKKLGSGLVLSSDCHNAAHLDFYFTEAVKLLQDIGFSYVYEIEDGAFVKRYL